MEVAINRVALLFAQVGAASPGRRRSQDYCAIGPLVGAESRPAMLLPTAVSVGFAMGATIPPTIAPTPKRSVSIP